MNNGIEIYQSPSGATEISVKFEQDSVWLNLNQMAMLFGRDKSVISRHLKNIFKEEELDKNSVVAFFATTATDGNKRIGALLFMWFLQKTNIYSKTMVKQKSMMMPWWRSHYL